MLAVRTVASARELAISEASPSVLASVNGGRRGEGS
jgi:hypothetical protein